MSVITDAVLLMHLNETDAIESLNAALRHADKQRQQQFARLDERAAGGSKFLCTEIWAAAFNHVVPDEIERCVALAPWRHPDDVTLYLHAYDYDLPPITRTVACLRRDLEAAG